MSVIPESQLLLSRQRKILEDALSIKSWQDIAVIDRELSKALDVATTDSEKNMDVLLKEVKLIVALYRQLVDSCRDEVSNLSSLTSLNV